MPVKEINNQMKPKTRPFPEFVEVYSGVDLEKVDLISLKELDALSITQLLDHQKRIEHDTCSNCQVSTNLKMVGEKASPSDIFHFCILKCPVGRCLLDIGRSYELRGRKRPVRDSISAQRKERLKTSEYNLNRNQLLAHQEEVVR